MNLVSVVDPYGVVECDRELCWSENLMRGLCVGGFRIEGRSWGLIKGVWTWSGGFPPGGVRGGSTTGRPHTGICMSGHAL